MPFAVINADDYYGKEAYRLVYQFLNTHSETSHQYCMAGFQLCNTLSDNGTVTRGICSMDAGHNLLKVTETHGLERTKSGQIQDEHGAAVSLDSLVSMNMWGLTPEFIHILEEKFVEFLEQTEPGNLKAEYLLPTIIDQLLCSGQISVKVLPTPDKWFGITYAADKDSVAGALKQLTAKGVYGSRLWE